MALAERSSIGEPESPVHRILVVDDEENMRYMLSILLKKEGYSVESAQNGVEALNRLEQESFDLVLSDIKMPEMDGLTFLSKVKEMNAEATVIMMSAFGSVDTAIEAMKRGAYDYVSKPFKADEILLTIRKVEERERLQEENKFLKNTIKKEFSFSNITARSPIMMSIFDTIRKIADFKTTVLIMGESGTGKELIAKALHFNSPRANKPFVTINCSAIPENLLESELFGHAKGSFTGAVRNKRGLFEEANGGTLFLDEVGELPLLLQVKLLRAIQEEEIRRVGENSSIKIDVRIIAATLKNLGDEIQKGTFREDLYYRLNVLPIRLPPLRDRKEDIPLLIDHFIEKYNRALSKSIRGMSPEALNYCLEFEWPGNVRELENTIERAVVLATSLEITADNLPSALRETKASAQISLPNEELSIKTMTMLMEEELIRKALRKTKGNKTKASRLLEISHRALLYKIKKYKIDDYLLPESE